MYSSGNRPELGRSKHQVGILCSHYPAVGIVAIMCA